MKVAIYPRVSSLEQAKSDSIDAQESRLRKFCEDRGYEIVEVYTDAGKSASIKDDKVRIKATEEVLGIDFILNQRPAFQKILKDARDGKLEAVVFFKWDRFSRNVIFAKLCKMYFDSLNIQLIPSDDSNDPLASSLMQLMGEEEVRKLAERIRSTRLLRFEQGMMVSKAPVGYKFNQKSKTMEVDEKMAKVVQDCFKMASEGLSYKEICSKHKLKPQQYYNIIKNKVYYGIITFEGVEKEGSHPHLISKELWEQANLRKKS